MKKNFLQDVIPANHRRSIRDVPLPGHRREISQPEPSQYRPAEDIPSKIEPKETPFQDKEPIFNPQNLQNPNYSVNNKENDHIDATDSVYEYKKPVHNYNNKYMSSMTFRKILLGVLIGIIIFLGFFFSRSSAQILIYPKQSTQQIDTTVPVESSSIVVQTQISQTETVSVEATSEQQVENIASGKIKVANLYSEEPQEIVKNTRFESPAGLIYRIKNPLTIPGFVTKGGEKVAGTIEVEVYADKAGEEYNISKTNFTIPGFKQSDQFTQITAESVTDMSGGYVGIKKVVSEIEREEANQQLREKLTQKFSQEPMISENNVVIPDGSTISFGELKDTVEGNTVIFSLTADLVAYSFKRQELSNFIGQNNVSDSSNTNVFDVDLSDLRFTIDSKTIQINGTSSIVWITDIDKLKKEISGKKKSEVPTIVNSYNSFSKADIDLKPFWKTSFPKNAEKIEVRVAE